MTTWLLHDHLNGPLKHKGVEFVGVLRPRRRADLHALTPHLYRVTDSAISQIRKQAEVMSRRDMPPSLCALIQADVDSSVLLEQLGRFCLVATPTAQWMYCRYFDPRVMTHLRWILAPDQLQSLLGRVSRWTFLDASSQWVEIDNEPQAPHWLRLTLDDTQARRLIELPTLRACLQQWRAHDPQAPRDDRDGGKRVAACLDYGQALGLRDLQDRVALALHELLIHPDIIRHPDIANAIALASGGEAYRHVTGNWPQARWETIQEQLTNRETT